jgi:hypothetical protein
LRRGLLTMPDIVGRNARFERVEGMAARKRRLPPMHEEVIRSVQPLGLTMRPLRQGTEGEPTAGGKLSAAGQATPPALSPACVNRLFVIMPPSHRSQFDGGQKPLAQKTPRDRS